MVLLAKTRLLVGPDPFLRGGSSQECYVKERLTWLEPGSNLIEALIGFPFRVLRSGLSIFKS
jgi:hypothetical protein